MNDCKNCKHGYELDSCKDCKSCKKIVTFTSWESDGGDKMNENSKEYIIQIRDWLRNLAEDRTIPMDVRLHAALWQEIQSIDHDLEAIK